MLAEILFALLGFSSAALAQDQGLANYALRTWTQRDGLPGTDVRSIAQTPDGYLWLATDGGLVRFDGVRFIPFTSPPSAPAPIGDAVCVAADGTLWVGLNQGGVITIRQGEATYRPPGNGLLQGHVRSIMRSRDGVMWVATSEGVSSYGLNGWQNFKLQGVSAWSNPIAEGDDGAIAVATIRGLFVKRPTDREFRPDPVARESIYSVVADPEGTFWTTGISSAGALSGRFAGNPHRLRIHSFVKDHSGNIWFLEGLLRRGLSVRRAANIDSLDAGERLTSADGLSSDQVRCLFADSEGNIWIGTLNGLNRISPSIFRRLRVPKEIDEDLQRTLFTAQDGGLVIGPFRNVGRAHVPLGRNTPVLAGNLGLLESFNAPLGAVVLPERVTPGVVQSGIDGALDVRVKGSRRIEDYPTLRYEPNDRVYTPGFLFRPTSELMTHEDVGGNVFARDRRGRVWMAKATGGLYLVEPTAFTPVPELEGNGIDRVACDQNGTVWAGGATGLFGLIEGRWRHFTTADGMFAGPVGGFYLAGDGSFWVLGASVSRLKDGHFSSFQTNIDVHDANAMVEDDDGAAWLVAPTGVVRVQPGEWDNASRDDRYRIKYRLFDQRDGLTSLPSGFPFSSARTRDGRLWFVLRDGIVSVDPHHIAESVRALSAQIEDVWVDETRIRTGRNDELSPHVRSVRIAYTAPSFVVPERLRFRVKLEGFDANWIDAGARREAVYTNLPPRRYTFRVRASDGLGPWTGAEAAWTFDVRPAFYQMYWFDALLLLVGVAVLRALYGGRLRAATRLISARYEERLAERLRIARDLHDTLLQSVAGASLHLQAFSKGPDLSPRDVHTISSIRQQLDVSLREARQKVWDLRSSQLEGRSLQLALEDWLNGISSRCSSLRFETSGRAYSLSPHAEEQTLRVAQECIANAVRHAAATSIVVELRYADDSVTLTVSDHGTGFDVASARRDGHWGLMTIEERAREIGATWQIVSEPGAGTECRLTVPRRT